MLHHFYNNRKTKKGFTLVEVIVVLVILAILAAILIPSMVGWIGKADEESVETQFNMMKKALISASLEIDVYETYYNKEIIIPLSEDMSITEQDRKFTQLVEDYLNPDLKGKYSMNMPQITEPNLNFSELLEKNARFFYYPNGVGSKPYYTYNGGKITKVE